MSESATLDIAQDLKTLGDSIANLDAEKVKAELEKAGASVELK
jgi:ribosomal protein L7/L12